MHPVPRTRSLRDSLCSTPQLSALLARTLTLVARRLAPSCILFAWTKLRPVWCHKCIFLECEGVSSCFRLSMRVFRFISAEHAHLGVFLRLGTFFTLVWRDTNRKTHLFWGCPDVYNTYHLCIFPCWLRILPPLNGSFLINPYIIVWLDESVVLWIT